MANILLLLLGALYKNVNSAVCVIIYYIFKSKVIAESRLVPSSRYGRYSKPLCDSRRGLKHA